MISSILSLFGRSKERELLDVQLSRFGLEPRSLSDAVKLTLLRLLKAQKEGDSGSGTGQSGQVYREEDLSKIASLFAYCLMGQGAFGTSNSAVMAEEVEARLSGTLVAPEGLDAQVLLLALHSGLADDAIAARFEWE